MGQKVEFGRCCGSFVSCVDGLMWGVFDVNDCRIGSWVGSGLDCSFTYERSLDVKLEGWV